MKEFKDSIKVLFLFGLVLLQQLVFNLLSSNNSEQLGKLKNKCDLKFKERK